MTNRVFRLLAEGDPAKGMEPSDLTPPEALTGDDQREVNCTFFATADESILSGVWECAPCREEIESYPVHEMMSVISGLVTVTTAEGQAETFTAGHVFFIPKGTKCTWEITRTPRKFYML